MRTRVRMGGACGRGRTDCQPHLLTHPSPRKSHDDIRLKLDGRTRSKVCKTDRHDRLSALINDGRSQRSGAKMRCSVGEISRRLTLVWCPAYCPTDLFEGTACNRVRSLYRSWYVAGTYLCVTVSNSLRIDHGISVCTGSECEWFDFCVAKG